MATVSNATVFGDGWWAEVLSDAGRLRLHHVYDKRGYKTPYPGDAAFLALAAAADAALLPTEQVEAENGVVV